MKESFLNHTFSTPKDNVIDLASRAPRARRQLIEQLFKQHARAVRLYLRGRSVPPDEIEDLVQELFTRLMGVREVEERMTDASGSVRSFLLTMAHNLVVDRQRKRRVRIAYVEEQREIEQLDERTPERIVAAQMELEIIRDVLLKMPLHWRVALVLQRMRDMSYEDIALHMGVTVKQVEHYLRRGMRRLRKAQRNSRAAGKRSC